MYTTTEMIKAAGLDPWAEEALLHARGDDREARLTEEHIAAAIDYCNRRADEARRDAGTVNPLFGEPLPDRSPEWGRVAEELWYFAARLKIRPAADYP